MKSENISNENQTEEPASGTSVPGWRLQTHASKMVEQTLEYRFLAELTTGLLRRGMHYEILRGDFDTHGYDIVVEANGVTRHIQLKASIVGGKAAGVPINIALATKPSGCVVRMRYDPATFEITGWEWYGGNPGDPLPALPDRAVRHSKANTQNVKSIRPNLRELRISAFEKISRPDEILERLLGGAPVIA